MSEERELPVLMGEEKELPVLMSEEKELPVLMSEERELPVLPWCTRRRRNRLCLSRACLRFIVA